MAPGRVLTNHHVVGGERVMVASAALSAPIDARLAAPAAILSAEVINDFVATLGMRDLPESERPHVDQPDGGRRPVFADRPESDSADDLPSRPRPVAEDYWSDWVFALDALFEANAKDGVGGEIDIDQNLALGEILAGLEARRTA
ncbi:virulence factor SrfC family protein [Jhaorihella thermophila]